MTITVPVPGSAVSRFVVAASEVPKDPYAMARAQITGSPGDAALEWLDSPLLRIRPVAAADSIWRDELTGVAVFDDDERERLLTAPGHLIIESEAPPSCQPRIARGVRAIARALAETTDGLLADLCTAQLVPPDRRVDGERDWFCLADRWLGSDCLINPDGDADDKPTHCACLCLYTRGLARFGLPELVVDRVACAYDLAATNLMRGLAIQLLTRLWTDPGVAELQMAETMVIEPEDMWAYWSARPLFGGRVPIRLTEADLPGLPAGRYLELLPHPDFTGTRVEWGINVLGEGLSSVAGWQPDDPPVRIDTEMPRAVGTEASGHPPGVGDSAAVAGDAAAAGAVAAEASGLSAAVGESVVVAEGAAGAVVAEAGGHPAGAVVDDSAAVAAAEVAEGPTAEEAAGGIVAEASGRPAGVGDSTAVAAAGVAEGLAADEAAGGVVAEDETVKEAAMCDGG